MSRFNAATQTLLSENQLLTEQQVFASMKAHCMLNEEYHHFTDDELRNLAEGWLSSAAHIGTDIVGFLDPTGLVDAAHALVYYFTGKPIMGTLTLLGTIPYVGDTFKFLKYGSVGKAIAKGAPIRNVALSNKTIGFLQKARNSIETASTKLVPHVQKILSNPRVAKIVTSKTGLKSQEIIKKVSSTINKTIQKIITGIDKIIGKRITAYQRIHPALSGSKYYKSAPDKIMQKAASKAASKGGSQAQIKLAQQQAFKNIPIKGSTVAAGTGALGRGAEQTYQNVRDGSKSNLIDNISDTEWNY